MSTAAIPLSRAFIWRRVHSLFGLWIVLFLVEHLLTNSQAALLIGANGEGFIRAVNFLKNLPYLNVIEIILIGVPILFHMVWGIRIAITSKMNSHPTDGRSPELKKYPRNHAYSWQRITSYILLVGIIAHVGFMRFYVYPAVANMGDQKRYFVRLEMDPGLYTVSDRLGVKLFNQQAIDLFTQRVEIESAQEEELFRQGESVQESLPPYRYHQNIANLMSRYQNYKDQKAYLEGLTARPIHAGQVIAESPDFGTATLLNVRDAFKSPLKCILYTLFVLSAVFHGFNGLWTFLITWGIVIKMRSQSQAVNWCYAAMLVLGFLGLTSVWGTYFLNLRN